MSSDSDLEYLFSDNFITINSNIEVLNASKLVLQLMPEYIIVNRVMDTGDLYRYVYRTKEFLDSVRDGINNNLNKKLEEYLDLHEYKGDKTVKVNKDPTSYPKILEDVVKMEPSKDFLILMKGDQTTGIIDRKTSTTGGEGTSKEPRTTRGGEGTSKEPAPTHTPDSTQIIERYPSARFPKEVQVEEVSPLEVMIQVEPPASGQVQKFELPHPPDQKEVAVEVIVDVDPDIFVFPANEKYYTTLLVPVQTQNSKSFTFHLVPKQAGMQTIVVKFYYQQTEIGKLSIDTSVVQKKGNGDTSSQQVTTKSLNFLEILPSPDLTLLIVEKRITPDFEYQVLLFSNLEPVRELGSINFRDSPEDKFRTLFRSIEQDNSQREVLKNRIKNIGMAIYDEHFPSALKTKFWAIRDKLKSIRVMTKDPWIPWEIVKPWRDLGNGAIEEDQFLCEKYSFARWLIPTKEDEDKGYKEMRNSPIRQVKLVVPSDTNLSSALEERDWIIKWCKNRGIEVSVDSSYEQVINSLQTGGFDILHFSTHGRFNNTNAMLSVVELEKSVELRPIDIAGVARRFGAYSPLVILNACQTGLQGFSFTGIQSWVKRFLDAGAPAFISTLWSVSDDIAYIFAKELYEELFKGTTLGEAVRIARNKCKVKGEVKGDPSWLTYQLYGHPNAIITFTNQDKE